MARLVQIAKCEPELRQQINELRRRHGLQPLEGDRDLATAAQEVVSKGMTKGPYNKGVVVVNKGTGCAPGQSYKTGDPELPPGTLVWSCDKSKSQDCYKYATTDACVTAGTAWTSYQWVYSDKPLEDNKEGLEYAQIVWPSATKVSCALIQYGILSDNLPRCVYLACVFDTPAELTNAALKENIKQVAKAEDQYSWCSLFAGNKPLCQDEKLQYDGTPVAKCCQASCAASSQ